MIREFIQVHHCSGFPLTPWQVQLIHWPFSDETFAAKRDYDEAMQVARMVASVRGLPIATPAHVDFGELSRVVVSEMQRAQDEAPDGFDYNFYEVKS